MNIAEIRKRVDDLEKQGFIPSQRKGDTGIGFTLEKALSLKENNIALPDFGSIELKSMRIGSNKVITLFTLNKTVWRQSTKDIIEKYGYWDSKKNRQSLYSSVRNQPNRQNLYIEISENQLQICHTSGDVVGTWEEGAVRDKIIEKLQALLLVKAETKIIQGIEHFWFKDAKILTGCNYESFFNLLKNGKAFIDIRMHIKENGAVRNRGTGFRLQSSLMEELYTNTISLME
jgi:hypothetical protein